MKTSFAKHHNFWAVVPAAGLGLRMGANVPKQYLNLGGKTVIERTLSTLVTHPCINKVIVALNEKDYHWQHLNIPRTDKLITTIGGAQRIHSVFSCLDLLSRFAKKEDWVLVHDAVRPLLTHAHIDQLIDRLCEHPIGGLLAIPLYDTLKRVDDDGYVCETLIRKQTWCAQTPQMFRFQLLMDSIRRAIENEQWVGDESEAIELQGKRPLVVHGDPRNIKITYSLDLELAELLI